MTYRNYKRNLSKIKLHTPFEHTTITNIEDQPSRYHSELIRRYDFANGKKTYADPTMDNYNRKWKHIVAKAKVGDALMDLQEDPKCPGIYSGDSEPIWVSKVEWDKMQTKLESERMKKLEREQVKKDVANDMRLKVIERVDSDLSPEEISGISQPQMITLDDDQVFKIAGKLQDSQDKVNVNIIPGGLGLEVYGPRVWLVLAREKLQR